MTEVLSVLTVCVPSAVTGFCFWYIERRLAKKEDHKELVTKALERDRQDFNMILLTGINASIALGKANAVALQNGKCNGETESALEYVRKVEHEQKEFLSRRAVEAIVE